MNNSPIGVFDSGIGGLTVLKTLIKELPNENFIYLGDTARVPYGTRDKETIREFSIQLVNFLMKKKVKALVIACNTISAVALKEIKESTVVPVINVIDPTVKEALRASKGRRIGIIATNATILSKSYDNKLKALDPSVSTQGVKGSLFVPLVEEGLVSGKEAELVARRYLREFEDIDTLILGSTHYPLLRGVIQSILPDVLLIDSAKPTAYELKRVLKENNLESNTKKPSYKFYLTDSPQRSQKIADLFFEGKFPGRFKKVDL